MTKGFLAVAALLALLIFMLSAGIAVMWLSAEPHQAVSQLYPDAVIPNSGKAVLVNHGRFIEWKLGLVQDNIVGFAAICACAAIALFSFVRMLTLLKSAPSAKA